MNTNTILEEQVNSRKGILLSEAYFGKPAKLVEASKQLDIISNRIKKDPYYNPMGSKENRIVERCLEEQFNLESVIIAWKPTTAGVNAFTFPMSTMVLTTPSSMDVKRTSTSISFKDKKGKHLNVVVFTSLVSIMELNGPQLMSTILHEIGHNFYANESYLLIRKVSIISSAFSRLFLLGDISDIMFLLTLGNGVFRKGLSTLNKKIDPKIINKLKVVFMMYDAVNIFNMTIGIFNGFKQLKILFRNPLVLTDDFIQSLLGAYSDEKFSDNFATIHGYGAEFSEFVKRINVSKNTNAISYVVNKHLPKPFSILLNAQMFIVRSFLSICDCHPDNYIRVYDQAKLLQNELKKQDLNPEVKKQLLKDLKDIENIYDSMTKEDYFKENNEQVKGFIYSLIGYSGRDRGDIKEFLFSRGMKGHDWESLKERKDRNRLKGMFLG